MNYVSNVSLHTRTLLYTRSLSHTHTVPLSLCLSMSVPPLFLSSSLPSHPSCPFVGHCGHLLLSDESSAASEAMIQPFFI